VRIAARKSGRERRWKMRLVRVDRHMPAKKVESVELSLSVTVCVRVALAFDYGLAWQKMRSALIPSACP